MYVDRSSTRALGSSPSASWSKPRFTTRSTRAWPSSAAENSTVHTDRGLHARLPERSDVGLAAEAQPGALTKYGVPDPACMVFTSYAGMIGSLPVLAQPLPAQTASCPLL